MHWTRNEMPQGNNEIEMKYLPGEAMKWPREAIKNI